jgi:hypothetical protein
VAEKEINSDYVSARQVSENIPPPAEKKRSRALWILLLVFLVFVATVFLTQHEDTIDWVEDYEAGIKLAKQQEKPILLAFYDQDIPFCWAMERHVYNNSNVIKYVEANFIPILIDVDKQPEIIKQYNISVYPTHYVKQPHSDELSNPLIGCYPQPTLFIERIDHLLNTTKQSNK